jgi:hypothetical protein
MWGKISRPGRESSCAQETPPDARAFHDATLARWTDVPDIQHGFEQVHPQRRGFMRHTAALCLFAGALALAPAAAKSQQPAAPTSQLLAVGTMAPDFELQGATRYGQLAAPVKLSDYRGDVVVLAFFFRVRTPG